MTAQYKLNKLRFISDPVGLASAPFSIENILEFIQKRFISVVKIPDLQNVFRLYKQKDRPGYTTDAVFITIKNILDFISQVFCWSHVQWIKRDVPFVNSYVNASCKNFRILIAEKYIASSKRNQNELCFYCNFWLKSFFLSI